MKITEDGMTNKMTEREEREVAVIEHVLSIPEVAEAEREMTRAYAAGDLSGAARWADKLDMLLSRHGCSGGEPTVN